ncbi:MAG: hypothetical protein K6T63_05965 [Alicyclobacillus herbarius]|uniref:glycerophosphodiester phosphodiesterase n=1 Tax=Alicyclobacillus herbarius TaxID=122960 RepID=UPI0023541DFF|nr:glycerophosphodiester phosphodiesterase family protein [Alicyclobacillus herbarius]MCL6632165.1 hypothetical protein [Alicyclobacillus herbarius]
MTQPQIQAHRGWSGRYPENTCLAYQRALDLPIEGIELDVQLSADGVPVVIHDATVDRTTDARGRVSQLTAEALARCNAAIRFSSARPSAREIESDDTRQAEEYGLAFQPIPTLEQALQTIWTARPDAVVNIELKVYTGDGHHLVGTVVPQVWALVDQCGVSRRQVHFSSFRHGCLAHLKRVFPDARIGLLYDRRVTEPWREALELAAESINLRHRWITADLIQACHAEGVQVAAWTVDDPARIAELFRAGVDVLISNQPDVAERVRRQWQKGGDPWASSSSS